MMTWLWSGMVVLSVIFGLATGQLDAVSEAALSGASSAVAVCRVLGHCPSKSTSCIISM